MTKRFIIATSNISKSVEDRLRRYLDNSDAQWWHWLPNIWLAVFDKGFTSVGIREDIEEIIKRGEFFVMDVPHFGEFSGRFADEEAEQVKSWLTKHWNGRPY